ncbi:ThiF family adenylyltransferase [Xanthomonas hortorum]|uniref:ThiF family adenylyltransferase n=1 Tax=Xanthomonas hortorum pv. hederae TaxID=453603 RepID=A0A9X4BVI3_9XANT|nr:ThiF family adenylyltransferase [Xanthomonas hortorum]MDC8640398.1 ThiF family adenylyltransferase [Xanthomonas hortorum pv. hederae]
MSPEYFQLDLVKLEDRSHASSRTHAMISAINANRDIGLIDVMRARTDEELSCVYIMVDVECHGVPTHNKYGLRFRERMLIVVPQDDSIATAAWAMRKDFPRLAHQNSVSALGPAQLCLYYEPMNVVARTWTAHSFLARILWWLEKNAKGELHLADQPLDTLFFESKHELVIPWDIADLVSGGKPLHVSGVRRADNGTTMRIANQVDTGQGVLAKLVKIDLEPVESGEVEWDPHTLGELNNLMTRRGANLLDPLRSAMQHDFPQQGLTQKDEPASVLVLLSIPLRRASTGHVEGVSYRAFFLHGGTLKVGAKLGALFELEGRFYTSVGILQEEQAHDWEAIGLDPVTVLWENTADRARSQSGHPDSGPKGTVVGAGSLGSALLELWIRSGWGTWTVIDKDHIRPHNLARHSALNFQIGQPKVLAVSRLVEGITRGASMLTGVEADVMSSANPEVARALRASDLVVDATADLSYPRASSANEGRARHVSVFVTPSGRSGVMMLEDIAKARCLRTIEAQYYRAIIRSEWGKTHLDGHRGLFWSGASCRDLSMVLPYSSVMIHACQFAESIPTHIRSDAAIAVIWQREPGGSTDAISLELFERRVHKTEGGLDVYMDEGLHDHLRVLRREALPNETGGILLGYHDFTQNLVVIVDALPAPRDSRGTPTSFERGTDGLLDLVEDARNRTAGIVGYVGEWHSHPDGYPAAPSRDDLIQLAQLAVGMNEEGLPVVQVIVGSHEIGVVQAEVQP